MAEVSEEENAEIIRAVGQMVSAAVGRGLADQQGDKTAELIGKMAATIYNELYKTVLKA